MNTNSQGTLVVIPTRNRASLASNAIRSVLNQPGCADTYVLVSDNSTSPEESLALTQFCAELKDERVCYIRPPKALSMAQHWDWAMHQALELYNVEHFIYLTDRVIFKPGELQVIKSISAAYPDKIVSYSQDRIVDYLRPICVDQYLGTGRLLEVSSDYLLRLSAQADILYCLPRMLNCCVPRQIIEIMRQRFGNVFSSIAPDYYFAYRCLSLVDSILYYDKAALVHYALERSNGAAQSRGITSKDNADFMANLSVPFNFAAPVPGFKTVTNTVMHEYCLVKSETGSPKFRDVDRGKYLLNVSMEIMQFEETELKQEMQALLSEQLEEDGLAIRARLLLARQLIRLSGRIKRALNASRDLIASDKPDIKKEFATVDEAINYAINCPPLPLSESGRESSLVSWLKTWCGLTGSLIREVDGTPLPLPK